MTINRLKQSLRRLELADARLSKRERVQAAEILVRAANRYVQAVRHDLQEEGAEAKRRQAKRRETELDPKPPVKPVRVAEPSKPRKPKYSGNHAPSARG